MAIHVRDAYDAGSRRPELYRNQSRWKLTWSELKLLLIASTGFFIDAYDLFNINLVVVILNYVVNKELNGSIANASLQGGVLKAAANIGCVIGQIVFGLAGDVYGRKIVYTVEMIITTIATVLIISGPLSLGRNFFTYITVLRVFMGIGIGGDYPMSACVVADRADLKRRGTMVAFVFAMQGWGSFIGGLVFLILMSIFKHGIQEDGHTGQLNAVWRIYTGLIIIPAVITIAQRIMLPESARMRSVQAVRADPSLIHRGVLNHAALQDAKVDNAAQAHWQANGIGADRDQAWADAREYFSEWRHLKILLGTTASWFLLDIIFYGIAINQAIFVSALGLASSKDPWEFLWQQGVANIIIAAAGFLPGYYFTMFFIEIVGRKPIQIMGLSFNALIFAVMAGRYEMLKTHHSPLIACFIFLQFFFNFGANATTFIIPAEAFPTRVRGFAHGLSAACGKCGAIIASLAVSLMATNVGPQFVLWLFCGIAVLAIPFTFLIPETRGRDADLIDLTERREAAATWSRWYRETSNSS
uniref:Major facilitator superfamily (MFS) profile domain-containing protein n=1 Tax=Mycena chlorophos TaxID=658473 RepID=A0ABQ0LLW0_MYCCL|nr:predicted protein [Mycena chlorophos]